MAKLYTLIILQIKKCRTILYTIIQFNGIFRKSEVPQLLSICQCGEWEFINVANKNLSMSQIRICQCSEWEFVNVANKILRTKKALLKNSTMYCYSLHYTATVVTMITHFLRHWQFAATNLKDAFDEGSLGQSGRTVHHLTIVIWTPAGRVDVYVLGIKTEGTGLDYITDVPVQHPYPYGIHLGHKYTCTHLTLINASNTSYNKKVNNILELYGLV